MAKLFGGTVGSALVHALTQYDARREKRPDYNRYALPQYLGRIAEVEADIAAGAPVRAAILAAFSGPVLDCALKAVGEPKHTREEKIGAVFYRPVTAA